ncbi:hypothetical protein MIS46_05425 [Wielerella bovis]|uniref:hypothetical protein n=1 Tax=Wielerella bovis TaxID=2917790 RepID=UPI002019EAA7|nr:hypothetical protein [Wielerella bovis]ULJ63487.1 hypothetical protein MIS46_05425 [Wielerella bovis]
MKPTIILAMPEVQGLVFLMEEALIEQGFQVINLHTLSQQAVYPNFWSWLYAKWRKIVHHDKQTAKHFKAQMLQHKLSGCLNGQMVDYALFISADCFHIDLIDYIKRNTRYQCINYQFDGLHRFPDIYARIKQFHHFYAFDPNDVKQHNLSFVSNFYFNHLPDESDILKDSIYFFGTHHDSRSTLITQFAQYIQQIGYMADISILCKHANQAVNYADSPIQIVKKGISFKENVLRAKQAQILLDFVSEDHAGLSFRIFEALGYRKKLITTNHHVVTYDFYHPNNIYILTADNFAGVAEFLARPYQTLDDKIYEKYGFTNWLRYVLNIEPHQKITLPQ